MGLRENAVDARPVTWYSVRFMRTTITPTIASAVIVIP